MSENTLTKIIDYNIDYNCRLSKVKTEKVVNANFMNINCPRTVVNSDSH